MTDSAPLIQACPLHNQSLRNKLVNMLPGILGLEVNSPRNLFEGAGLLHNLKNRIIPFCPLEHPPPRLSHSIQLLPFPAIEHVERGEASGGPG